MLEPVGGRFDLIWAALEAGHNSKALELAKRLDSNPNDHEAMLVAAIVHAENGNLKEAYDRMRALEGKLEDLEQEFERRVHLAQLSYLVGYPKEALYLFQSIEPEESVEKANIVWWQGLCSDHLGKSKQADKYFAQAQKLDPEGAPRPLEVNLETMAEMVQEVLINFPEKLQLQFDNLDIAILDLPDNELIRQTEGQLSPDCLGVYIGPKYLKLDPINKDRSESQMQLYRRNLERFAESKEDFLEDIRMTLLRELGRHLGYTEENLDRLWDE